MTEPWYKDGLKFRCTQCGDCCTGDPGFVWVSDEEIEAICKYTGEDPLEFQTFRARKYRSQYSLREKANGDCVYFEKGAGCVIYPVRPTQCRTWPFWDSRVATPEAWEETCKICPGSGQGDLISPEEITMRLKKIRL